MKRSGIQVIAVLLFATIAGCGDDNGTEIGDHTWVVSYHVSNSSSEDISVVLSGPAVNGGSAYEVEAGTGEKVLLLSYSAFLAPPPDASLAFWCVSVHRLSDRALIKQLCPVSNGQWVRRDPREFEAEFTLMVAQEDLEPVLNSCPRLDGVVVDASTGDPIGGVDVYLEAGAGYTVFSDESGAYWLPMPGDMPVSKLNFYREGYRLQTLSFPAALQGVGENFYRLDVELVSIE